MVTPLEGNRIDPEKAQYYWVSSDGLSRLPFLKTYIYIYKKKKKNKHPLEGKMRWIKNFFPHGIYVEN